MSSISITCKEAKIEAEYSNGFSIEMDRISAIEGNVDDVLTHFSAEELSKYKHITDVVEEMDVDVVLKCIDKDYILEYVAKNDGLVQALLDMIDEKFIIGKARKLRIETLLKEEK